ncbi:MAG TPA: tetratricopeptide repeat protein [Candidatus Methylomirabilis sp.]|nr:tetratricopeptide repeat protein [Candidatus Methylomirabilis sp.]
MAASDHFSPLAIGTRLRWGQLALGIVLAAVVAGGYWVKTRPAPAVSSEEASMKAGLDALYTGSDPGAAIQHFRKALALNPTHYGATYQLATALDRAGRPQEARPYWERLKPMAEEAKDEQTLAAVRARLAAPEKSSDEAIQTGLMDKGLDALYKRGDPAAAIALFRRVLERNPAHYGATYQLATSLDRAGKPAEARPLWEKVAAMAETYQDQKTLDAARARLARP